MAKMAFNNLLNIFSKSNASSKLANAYAKLNSTATIIRNNVYELRELQKELVRFNAGIYKIQ